MATVAGKRKAPALRDQSEKRQRVENSVQSPGMFVLQACKSVNILTIEQRPLSMTKTMNTILTTEITPTMRGQLIPPLHLSRQDQEREGRSFHLS